MVWPLLAHIYRCGRARPPLSEAMLYVGAPVRTPSWNYFYKKRANVAEELRLPRWLKRLLLTPSDNPSYDPKSMSKTVCDSNHNKQAY